MKINRKKLLLIFLLVLLIGAVLLVLTACDPSIDVKVVNGTDQVLTIYRALGSNPPARQGSVQPGEHIYLQNLALMFTYVTIIAKNDQDETVYSGKFDLIKLKDDMKCQVVIPPPEDK